MAGRGHAARMRVLLPMLAALLALVLVPAPAQAHDCDVDNVACLVQCPVHAVQSGDTCGVNEFDLPSLEPCAAGEVGVLVAFEGRSVRLCLALDVRPEPCPPGQTGVIVVVNGRATTACADL